MFQDIPESSSSSKNAVKKKPKGDHSFSKRSAIRPRSDKADLLGSTGKVSKKTIESVIMIIPLFFGKL